MNLKTKNKKEIKHAKYQVLCLNQSNSQKYSLRKFRKNMLKKDKKMRKQDQMDTNPINGKMKSLQNKKSQKRLGHKKDLKKEYQAIPIQLLNRDQKKKFIENQRLINVMTMDGINSCVRKKRNEKTGT